MLGETWRHSGVHEELSRLTNLCLYASIFVNTFGLCIAKSKASKWVETWCRNGVEELHATALCNANIFLRSGHACTVKPGVATEFRHEKWQMSPDQMPPCIPCITYMHSTVFLRSGQACTLPPGVARESRNDQCQMSPNQMLPVQFTRTCSMTSLRHVLFPKHRFHRFRWF